MLKLSTIKVGDRSVPELKKNLFSILVAYKSVFDGPLMLERLLKPMMKLTFKDISKTVETVKLLFFLLLTRINFKTW